MSELITAARPYARAAFEAASEHGAVEHWSDALDALAAAVANPDVERLIADPRRSAAEVADVMIALPGGARDERIHNFIRLLAENRRLRLAPDVAALFKRYRAEAERTSVVEITSAQSLDDAQRDALCRAIERRTGRKVEAECRTDETLLGGAVVRIDDFVVDGSVKTRLEQLSQTLAH